MIPKEGDWAARMKMDQKMTHICAVVGRLMDILTEKYGVEDIIDPMAKNSLTAARPPPMGDSPTVQLSVL